MHTRKHTDRLHVNPPVEKQPDRARSRADLDEAAVQQLAALILDPDIRSKVMALPQTEQIRLADRFTTFGQQVTAFVSCVARLHHPEACPQFPSPPEHQEN